MGWARYWLSGRVTRCSSGVGGQEESRGTGEAGTNSQLDCATASKHQHARAIQHADTIAQFNVHWTRDDMDSSTHSALQASVSALRSSMHLLDSSISILDAGVSDYPRLVKVLQTTRHFELVSAPTLQAAQTSLLSELQPEFSSLLSRTEAYLDKLARREASLIAKAELQEGRLSRTSSGGGNLVSERSVASVGGGTAGGLNKMEELKVQQLRQKKERLSYAVSRLELQAGQRERQLRKSMAAQ